MASRPKLARLLLTLKRMAEAEIGEGAEPIDFIEARVAGGQTVTDLAKEVQKEMNEPASRGWLSWRFNALPTPDGTPTAKQRLAVARKEAAMVLADEALSISDEEVETSAQVQRNRLRSDVRLNLAKAFDPSTFREGPTIAVVVTSAQNHLDALRLRHVQAKTQPPLAPASAGVNDDDADFEIVSLPSERQADETGPSERLEKLLG